MIDCLNHAIYHGFGHILVVVERAKGYQVAEDIQWLLDKSKSNHSFTNWVFSFVAHDFALLHPILSSNTEALKV